MASKNSRAIALCIFLSFVTALLHAQDATTITGQVSDAISKITLPEVLVLERGTENQSVTDANGEFSIAAASNAVLVFSLRGYILYEVHVNGQNKVDIFLQEKVVVDVGYGTMPVSDVTGSVAGLGRESFNRGVISTPEQLFQGRTAGVTVSTTGGEPGAVAQVDIRGVSSISANNPIYVVDGIPLDNSNTLSSTGIGLDGGSIPKNPLSFINPNDIERITFLKDAAATSIYGIRGANGIVMITTKNGKNLGRNGSFSFNSYVGTSSPAKRYNLLNAGDFLNGINKADGGGVDITQPPINRGSSTDWQDQILRTGISNGYNLGWGTSRDGTTLRISGSYDNQQGIVKNSGLQRLTARINFTQKLLKDKLTVDVNATLANVKNGYAANTATAGFQGSLIGAAIYYNPTAPVHNANGSFFDANDGTRNPAAMLNYYTDNDNINRSLANVSASYEIVKGLVAKLTYGFSSSASLRKSFSDPRIPLNWSTGTTVINGTNYGNPIPGNGRAVYQYINNVSILNERTLAYGRAFGRHSIDALAGFSDQSFEVVTYGNVAWGLNQPVSSPSDNFVKDIHNFVNVIPFVPTPYSKYTLKSYFGRIHYSFDDRYLVTATVRSDVSSLFANNSQLFYGTSVKWKIMNERFANGALSKLLSELSIRSSFGQAGNQNVPNANLTTLKAETSTTSDVGLDWALRSNRISGTIDYFRSDRKDMLYFGPSGGGFGSGPSVWQNLDGHIVNSGLEFSLKYGAIAKGKFGWSVAYNMTFFHNEVTGFNKKIPAGNLYGPGLTGAYSQLISTGIPLFTANLPVFQGFDANGFSRYANGGQPQNAGSALPKFTAGLTNRFTYENWSLSFLFTTTRGFYVYNNTANAFFIKGSLGTGRNVDYATAASSENRTDPGSVSTRFLEKGNFIRLSNARLGYTFKINSKRIRSLSANITAQNLFMITNYSGLDPEVASTARGIDYAAYPRARTFTLGVSMDF